MGLVKAFVGIVFLIGVGWVALFGIGIWIAMAVNERTRAGAQAYNQGRYQLALACGLSDMELETGSGPAERFQCLRGVSGSNLLWNGQCGSADSSTPEMWARCIVARYVKRCDFKLSQHAETYSDGRRIDMEPDECVGTQTLKLWASN
jgi:hypothetical protein